MDPPRERDQMFIIDNLLIREHLPTISLALISFWRSLDLSNIIPPPELSVIRFSSMAQQTERRPQDGQRLFSTGSDGVCNLEGFSNKETWKMDVMDSQSRYSAKQSDQQESYDLGWNTLRDYPETSTITIDNVKSKIHGAPYDSIAAWCFGIMSSLAFAMMILLGGLTSIDRWSASGTIVRLVFILGTPLWQHRASMQAGRDLKGTTKQRAVGGFLIESQSPIHESSSRRPLSSPVLQ